MNDGLAIHCLNHSAILPKLVPRGRLELPHISALEPKSSASTNSATRALNTVSLRYLLVPPPGIEPGSEDFQSSAMTTFAKAAVVPCDRIELPYPTCKEGILPLN